MDSTERAVAFPDVQGSPWEMPMSSVNIERAVKSAVEDIFRERVPLQYHYLIELVTREIAAALPATAAGGSSSVLEPYHPNHLPKRGHFN